MRRLALLALLLPLVVVAPGCGSDKQSASGPLDEALRYLPEKTPFAAAIDTDVNGGQYQAAGKIAKKFAFGGQVEDELKKLFERGNVDFDRDVKPLLGNPFVVGAVDARTFTSSGSNEFIGAIKTKDGDKLEELVKKGGADEKGEKEGAKLYQDRSGDTFAVKDDVLVVAGSKKLLEDALKRRNGSDALTEDKFDASLEGLPKQALVRSYFDLEGLLGASSGGRQATKVKWVGAMRTLGLVGEAREDSIAIAFNLKTDPSGLSDKDLPIAAGDSAPKLVRRAGELSLGLRDPGHVVDFGIDAASALEGAAVEAGKLQLEKQLGIDVERDLTEQLTGDTSVEVTPAGDFGVRAELRDAAAFQRTLAKLAPTLPSVAEGVGFPAAKLSKPKGGLYTLSSSTGSTIVFGVSHGVLVAANDAGAARRLASASPEAVPGAAGSLVISADAQKLADAILKQLSSQLGPLVTLGGQLSTGPLGDLTGSVKTTTSGMKGTIELKFD